MNASEKKEEAPKRVLAPGQTPWSDKLQKSKEISLQLKKDIDEFKEEVCDCDVKLPTEVSKPETLPIVEEKVSPK